MVTVFFSYSHVDEQLRDQLEVHLAALKRQGLIDTWYDRRIVAGDKIDEAVDGRLEQAEIILCLISPDFIASDYCYSREMKRALERHNNGEARLIPVILRHCEWDQTPLKGLRGTPRDNKPIMAWADRDEAFNYVARDIRKAIEEIDHKPPAKKMPEPIAVAAPPTVTPGKPRSANLHVKKEFTDLERDTFLREAFDFITEFFANSIRELKDRHAGIEGRFTRVDANRFTATLYKNGKKQSAMTVFLGGMFGAGREISFNNSDAGNTNTSNGSFSITETADGLGFKSSFSFGRHDRDEALKADAVAEEFWSTLVRPLQD